MLFERDGFDMLWFLLISNEYFEPLYQFRVAVTNEKTYSLHQGFLIDDVLRE